MGAGENPLGRMLIGNSAYNIAIKNMDGIYEPAMTC